MPWNGKSLRLRTIRDQLHCKTSGHVPTFNRAIELITEVVGTVWSPRYLNWCREEVRKLRDRTPDPTPEQVKRLAELDERIARRVILIEERAAKRAEREAKKNAKAEKTEVAETPAQVQEEDPFYKW